MVTPMYCEHGGEIVETGEIYFWHQPADPSNFVNGVRRLQYTCHSSEWIVSHKHTVLPTDTVVLRQYASGSWAAQRGNCLYDVVVEDEPGCLKNHPAVTLPLTADGEVVPIIVPRGEGENLGVGSVDKWGNADQMANDAAEYLRAYAELAFGSGIYETGAVGRPAEVIESLPRLRLLYAAAELVFKAFILREGDIELSDYGHVLTNRDNPSKEIYGYIPEHCRKEVEKRFDSYGYPPSVRDILDHYGSVYTSSVYRSESGLLIADPRRNTEARDRRKRDLSEPGANISVAVYLPRPVYLPLIVQVALDVYQNK